MNPDLKGLIKNFLLFEEALISGTPHIRVQREDDGYEFYMDPFFLELADMLAADCLDIKAVSVKWDVPREYIDWAVYFLITERLVMKNHENC